MKILIFRSVTATYMGAIVTSVIKKFGDGNKITIITRPENCYAMSKIGNVNNVLSCSLNQFVYNQISTKDLANLKQHNFDLAIIPVNGKPDSYKNIVDFCIKIFGNIPVYFHTWVGKFSDLPTSEFVEYRSNLFLSVTQKTVRLVSALGSIALLAFYLFSILYFSLLEVSKKGSSD